MAQVNLANDLGRRFAGGEIVLDLDVTDVRGMIKELESRYPGIAEILQDGSTAMAIDGTLYQEAWLETLKPTSEVHFLPAIKGG